MGNDRIWNLFITLLLLAGPAFAALTSFGLAWLCHILGESWTMPIEVILILGSAWMVHGCRVIWAERKFIEEVDDESP
ncbi:hypothetical protein [Microbulbifer celer]|uniref:Uncharacterized protein n=1 Tax=Microbulbifer celer TaxID=435905 RepID=A0ABW3U687_9GAMM|nr:hypothetical protein [Microbulbifer celer]UFN58564.1 hypothetical protein LPW13_05845 [Microbulbifer celer]